MVGRLYMYWIRIRAIIRSGGAPLLQTLHRFAYIIMLYMVFIMFYLLGFSYTTMLCRVFLMIGLLGFHYNYNGVI
jgi:hypothetical protein